MSAGLGITIADGALARLAAAAKYPTGGVGVCGGVGCGWAGKLACAAHLAADSADGLLCMEMPVCIIDDKCAGGCDGNWACAGSVAAGPSGAAEIDGATCDDPIEAGAVKVEGPGNGVRAKTSVCIFHQ